MLNAFERVFASIGKWVLNNSSIQSIEVTGMIESHVTSLGERLAELLAERPSLGINMKHSDLPSWTTEKEGGDATPARLARWSVTALR